MTISTEAIIALCSAADVSDHWLLIDGWSRDNVMPVCPDDVRKMVDRGDLSDADTVDLIDSESAMRWYELAAERLALEAKWMKNRLERQR